jgi:flagellar biosynthesis GTPase FlhF
LNGEEQMRLYRFVALDSQRAMVMVRQQLGNNAYVYSTRSTDDGVEVIAGGDSTIMNADDLSSSEEIQVQSVGYNPKQDDKLNLYLQTMEENIIQLSNYVVLLHKVMTENKQKKLSLKKPLQFLKKLLNTKIAFKKSKIEVELND